MRNNWKERGDILEVTYSKNSFKDLKRSLLKTKKSENRLGKNIKMKSIEKRKLSDSEVPNILREGTPMHQSKLSCK